MEGKPFYYSKTVWVNALALVGPVAAMFGATTPEWMAISTGVLALANLVLRYFTNEPVEIFTPKAEAPKEG